MSIHIYHRYSTLDKRHEYSIVVPFPESVVNVIWNYWFWYYIGSLTKGKHNNPSILPFANTWDEDCILIKTYKDHRAASTSAELALNFIKKHYTKKSKKIIGFK